MKRVGIAALVAALGGILWAIGLRVETTRALHAYLFAYAFTLTTVLGSLFVVVVLRTAEATWIVAFRRLAESVSATLPILALAFVPIALGIHSLYPWAGAPVPLADGHHLGAHARSYLATPFFIGRAAFYFVVWLTIAELLRAWSMRQDVDPDPRLVVRQSTLSAAAIPVLGLTITFAAFDWLMSLEPGWTSTIYGVYLFAGGFLAALALLGVLAFAARGVLPPEVGGPHFAALGKLLLTFLLFWAYSSFSQLLLIWIADLPHEVPWYARRTNGTWAIVDVVLVVFHFAVPLAALLSFRWKRSGAFVAAVGGFLLVMHALDVAWLVLPVIEPAGAHFSWVDAAALAFVVGATTAFGLFRARKSAPYPVGDPCLPLALRYEDA